jgi:starch synthase
VAPLLKEIYSGPVAASSLSKAGVVLTIHNIAFQGWLTPDFLSRVGLDPNRVYRSECLMDDGRPGFLPGHHDINLLKGGVVYADKVTTVSPTYAREVFDPHFGMGLESVLKKHGKKFKGVLNGIDHESWSPESDPLIPHHYSPADPPGAHAGKMACKRSLLQELGLPLPSLSQPGSHLRPEGDRPLLAVVSRLTDQKGLPLILHGIKAAISKGAMVVLLGSAPDPNVQKVFQYMSEELKQGSDARFILRHDEALSHRIYAGADMILIPSQFEPCGLTQLISLRYGTIPVVRETGGLVDTVKDVSDDSIPEHERNGFTFKDSSEAAVEHTIGRAIEAYSEGYDWWVGVLVRRAMSQDWSWSRSAQDYLQLYRSLQPT